MSLRTSSSVTGLNSLSHSPSISVYDGGGALAVSLRIFSTFALKNSAKSADANFDCTGRSVRPRTVFIERYIFFRVDELFSAWSLQNMVLFISQRQWYLRSCVIHRALSVGNLLLMSFRSRSLVSLFATRHSSSNQTFDGRTRNDLDGFGASLSRSDVIVFSYVSTSSSAEAWFHDEEFSTPRVATISERYVAISKSRQFHNVLVMKVGATLDKFMKQRVDDDSKLQRRWCWGQACRDLKRKRASPICRQVCAYCLLLSAVVWTSQIILQAQS